MPQTTRCLCATFIGRELLFASEPEDRKPADPKARENQIDAIRRTVERLDKCLKAGR